MYYEIKSSALKKLVNVEHSCSDASPAVTREMVKQHVLQGRVSCDDNAPQSERIACRAAYLAINYMEQHQLIEIDLGNETGMAEKVFTNEQSVAQWFACMHNGHASLQCSIQGERKFIKALLKSAKELAPESLTVMRAMESLIDWKSSQEIVSTNWDNIEAILEKIAHRSDEELRSFVKLIPMQVWQSGEFLDKVQQANADSITFLPTEVLGSDFFVEYCSEHPEVFLLCWDRYERILHGLATQINNIHHAVDESNQGLPDIDEDILSPEMNTPMQCLHLLQGKEKNDEEGRKIELARLLYEKLLCKQEHLPFFIESGYIATLYPYLSKEMQMTKAVMDHIHNARGGEFVFQIPPEFFKEKETTLSFLESSIVQENFPGRIMPAYIRHHFNEDEDAAYRLLKKAHSASNQWQRQKMANHIHLNLSPSLYRSDDFLVKLLSCGDREVAVTLKSRGLEAQFFQRSDVLQAIFANGHHALLGMLNDEVIFSLPIKKYKSDIVCLLEELPHILSSSLCPKSWRQEVDFICAVGPDEIELSAHEWKKIAKDEESCMKLVAKSHLFYAHLPSHFKSNVTITMQALNHGHDLKREIPPHLWAQKDFCLQALKTNGETAKYICAAHWQDASFIKEVFSMIDKEELSREILKYSPPALQHLLDGLNVAPGALNSFFQSLSTKQKLHQQLPPSENKKKNKL